MGGKTKGSEGGLVEKAETKTEIIKMHAKQNFVEACQQFSAVEHLRMTRVLCTIMTKDKRASQNHDAIEQALYVHYFFYFTLSLQTE